MEDLAAKLSELLESPDGLDTVKSLAGMLMGGGNQAEDDTSDGGDDSPFSSIDPNQISMMMKIGTALASQGSDDRSRLLLALRPHVSEEKQKRIDSAVKLLKLISLLPLISESGLF